MDLIEILCKKNQILENMIIALREKTREITLDYSEYYELSQEEIYRTQKIEEHIYWDSIETGDYIQRLKRSIEESQTKVEQLGTEKSDLHAKIASKTDTRQQTWEIALSAMKDSEHLKQTNKKLIDRLEYQGPHLSESKDSFLADRRNRGIAEKEIKQLDLKILNFIDLIGDKPVAAYSRRRY